MKPYWALWVPAKLWLFCPCQSRGLLFGIRDAKSWLLDMRNSRWHRREPASNGGSKFRSWNVV